MYFCIAQVNRASSLNTTFALIHYFGPVVQLVRIPACHAGGRGFESRPDRQVQCNMEAS